MWISRAAFERMVEARFLAEGRAHTLEQQVGAQKNTMDWMAMRLTQSEHERAQLIHNYTGVKIAVPSIEPGPGPALSSSDILNAGVSFEDMGDAEAQKQGVDWNDAGEVVHTGKR